MTQGTGMKRSTAKPYEGGDPYIFVSYCHKDRRFVLPIIEHLARDGYRIWYDEGIDPGSEWNEVIATHMNHSDICVAFISENAAASHNCKREINFALLKNKPLLSVFLEDTILSPGMEMQLSAYQCVFAYSYPTNQKCLEAVKSAPGLFACLGEPDLSVTVESYDDDSQSHTEYCLIRQSTGEEIPLNSETLYIGRNAEEGQKSYVISGDYEIGRKHMFITQKSGVCYVTDRKSKNHTFVNGAEIPPEKSVELTVGDHIRIGNVIFVLEQKTIGG